MNRFDPDTTVIMGKAREFFRRMAATISLIVMTLVILLEGLITRGKVKRKRMVCFLDSVLVLATTVGDLHRMRAMFHVQDREYAQAADRLIQAEKYSKDVASRHYVLLTLAIVYLYLGRRRTAHATVTRAQNLKRTSESSFVTSLVRNDRCAACDKIHNQKLMCCSGCSLPRYCDVACQKADWPRHKTFCKKVRGKSSTYAYEAILDSLATNWFDRLI